MLINPDTNKPAQEVFSRKKKTQNHPNISFNNIQVEKISHQKHLGIINFKELQNLIWRISQLILKNISTVLF